MDDSQAATAFRHIFRTARFFPTVQDILEAAPGREDRWRREIAPPKAVSYADHVAWLRSQRPTVIDEHGPPPRPLEGMNVGFEYIRTLKWLGQQAEAKRVEDELRARGWTPTAPNSIAMLGLVLSI